MARSSLANTQNDLNSDSGGVLWSLIKGEQLEFEVTMSFVEDVTTVNYIYEAVVMEADNVADQTTKPTSVKPNGVITTLTVRVPVNRGQWNSTQAYNKAEIVYYGGKYYALSKGAARTSAITPDLDPLWYETNLNTVYIQFLNTLGSTWSVQPTIVSNVYGFFELRVTEPTDSVFTKTWKPVRGMIELLYSPTDVV